MYKQLGLKFSQYRIDKGLTANDVAKHCGITLATVHKIEEGELDKVKLDHIVAACKVVGCNLHISFKEQDVGDETRKDSGSRNKSI